MPDDRRSDRDDDTGRPLSPARPLNRAGVGRRRPGPTRNTAAPPPDTVSRPLAPGDEPAPFGSEHFGSGDESSGDGAQPRQARRTGRYTGGFYSTQNWLDAGAPRNGEESAYRKGGRVKAAPKKFIAKAIKKPGALRATLGAKKGQPIPKAKVAAAAKAPGKLGQRARFAQTLAKMRPVKKARGGPIKMADGGSTADRLDAEVAAQRARMTAYGQQQRALPVSQNIRPRFSTVNLDTIKRGLSATGSYPQAASPMQALQGGRSGPYVSGAQLPVEFGGSATPPPPPAPTTPAIGSAEWLQQQYGITPVYGFDTLNSAKSGGLATKKGFKRPGAKGPRKRG